MGSRAFASRAVLLHNVMTLLQFGDNVSTFLLLLELMHPLVPIVPPCLLLNQRWPLAGETRCLFGQLVGNNVLGWRLLDFVQI